MGALILWVGWLLFNAGSSFGVVGDKGLAAQRALANSIISPSISCLVVFSLDQKLGGNQNVRYCFLSLTNGILAGLVSITASCDKVYPWAAIIIGSVGAFVYMGAARLMQKLRIDDPLEAAQVHGFCGLWGVLAVAFFKIDEGIFFNLSTGGRILCA